MSALYAARTIIAASKEATGKDHYEWRTLLLNREFKDLQDAREFLLTEGLHDGYIDFLFWTSVAHMTFSKK